MKKWEYYIGRDCEVEELDELGKDGWELVAVVEGQRYWVFYFKRPL